MEYKLFDDYITLQALLKEIGIIQSGGAIKAYLAEHTVYFNGEKEERRGKKLRLEDRITIPDEEIEIVLVAPSTEELISYKEDQEEKARVAKLVKEMNKSIKKEKQTGKNNSSKKKKKKENQPVTKSAPVRFPGT